MSIVLRIYMRIQQVLKHIITLTYLTFTYFLYYIRGTVVI